MERRVVALLLFAFAAYFVIQAPVEAAELVRATVGGIAQFLNEVAQSLSTFVRNLV